MIGELERLRKNLADAEQVVADLEKRINGYRSEAKSAGDSALGMAIRAAARRGEDQILLREMPAAVERVKAERKRLSLGERMRDDLAARIEQVEANKEKFGDSISGASATLDLLQVQLGGLPPGWNTGGLQTIKAFLRQCQSELSGLDRLRESLASWDGYTSPEHDVAQVADEEGGDRVRLEAQDHLAVFLSDCLAVGEDERATNREFARAYRRWCRQYEFRGLKGPALEFGLAELGIVAGRFFVNGKRLRGWRGASVKA